MFKKTVASFFACVLVMSAGGAFADKQAKAAPFQENLKTGVAGIIDFLVSPANAGCNASGERPEIDRVSRASNSNQISISWHFNATTFCVYPPDFYQVRWTKGDGPETQSQSPKIGTSSYQAGWVLPNADPNRVYGFIVQACQSHLAASSTCSGWSPMRYYKPYGPNMCRSGFVWREAFQGDVVCVAPGTRGQAKADNQQAAARRADPNSSSNLICKNGYVWREASPDDHVCVTPATRQQTHNDNAQRYSRALP